MSGKPAFLPRSTPPAYYCVQKELGSQGPVIHAQTVHQGQGLEGALEQLGRTQEVILEDPLEAQEVQFPVLLPGEVASSGRGKEGVVLESREDGFLEMQETGNGRFGGTARNPSALSLRPVFSRLLATPNAQSNPETQEARDSPGLKAEGPEASEASTVCAHSRIPGQFPEASPSWDAERTQACTEPRTSRPLQRPRRGPGRPRGAKGTKPRLRP